MSQDIELSRPDGGIVGYVDRVPQLLYGFSGAQAAL